MTLQPIIRRQFTERDRAELQETIAQRVEQNANYFLKRYEQLPQSFKGCYINSDLFKEIFPEYAASKEAKTRYNAVVHNAAAVLAAEQFRRIVADPLREGKKVIFLTGIPGAGKTSSIIISGELAPDIKAVYEGQLSDAKFAIPKIQDVLDAALEPEIVAVHTPPERALENTFKRFYETGRGAGIHVMAKIQGELPSGLAAIREHFGGTVHLKIIDRSDATNTVIKTGWENLDLLQKEGDYEYIKQRLTNAFHEARRTGRISEACYLQANGNVPQQDYSKLRGVARQDSDRPRQDESG